MDPIRGQCYRDTRQGAGAAWASAASLTQALAIVRCARVAVRRPGSCAWFDIILTMPQCSNEGWLTDLQRERPGRDVALAVLRRVLTRSMPRGIRGAAANAGADAHRGGGRRVRPRTRP